MAKRRKVSIKKIIRFIILLIIIAVIIFFITKLTKNLFAENKTMYISATTSQIDLYDENLKPAIKIFRGEEVKIKETDTLKDNEDYLKVNIDNKTYYVSKDNLVSNQKNIIKEEKVYVRTPTVLLKSEDSIEIVANLSKETELQVLSYDKVDKQGNVNMYKVKQGGEEGYVYSKYTTLTKEESAQTYNMEKHTKIKNLYGGGDVKKLDFFPVEKIKFSENKMPEAVYSLYLNDTSSVLSKVDD